MSRVFKIGFCTFILIILCACSFNFSASTDKSDEIRVEFSYNSSAGEEVVVDVGNDSVVEVTTESPDKDKCEGMDGCQFTTYYIIKGKATGRTTVTLTKRDIVNNKEIRKIKYNVAVDKNLKIRESHTDKSE